MKLVILQGISFQKLSVVYGTLTPLLKRVLSSFQEQTQPTHRQKKVGDQSVYVNVVSTTCKSLSQWSLLYVPPKTLFTVAILQSDWDTWAANAYNLNTVFFKPNHTPSKRSLDRWVEMVTEVEKRNKVPARVTIDIPCYSYLRWFV